MPAGASMFKINNETTWPYQELGMNDAVDLLAKGPGYYWK